MRSTGSRVRPDFLAPMPHHLLNQITLKPGADWDDVTTRFESFPEAVADCPGLEHAQLLRIGPVSAVLLLRFSDQNALDRVSVEVIEPWLTAHLREFLAGPVSRSVGENVFEFNPGRGSEPPVSTMDDAARMRYFLRTIQKTGTVWGLYGTGWARSSVGDTTEVLPFWPEAEFAARCVRDAWSDCAPREIALDTYLKDWLCGMDEDGIVAEVFPTPTQPGLLIPPRQLATRIRAEK